MTVKEVLKTVAAMPKEEWIKVQYGIAELISSKVSKEEIEEIRHALAEADAEFAQGKGVDSKAVRKELGLA
jgi:hypothetical protein